MSSRPGPLGQLCLRLPKARACRKRLGVVYQRPRIGPLCGKKEKGGELRESCDRLRVHVCRMRRLSGCRSRRKG
eukprot:767341-Hanusia_phi.AAC.1